MRDPLREVFSNLDRWRHLPSYQCERRLDVFLSPYLYEILEPSVRKPLGPVIIPEMPLKQRERNLTDKADYVLFSRDGTVAYILELKTDCGSTRAKQDTYLQRLAARQWSRTLEDLKAVVTASKKRRKYIHLLALLESAGQVKLDENLFKCFERDGAARFQSPWVTVTTKVEHVETWFIMPKAMSGRRCITFQDICDRIQRYCDPMSTLLTTYLRMWTDGAGNARPVCRYEPSTAL